MPPLPQLEEGFMRRVSESFQAMIWGDPKVGNFRVKLHPYKYGDTKSYVSDMNAEVFSDFIATFGADLGTISGAISLKQALIVEDVEIDDAGQLESYGFALEES